MFKSLCHSAATILLLLLMAAGSSASAQVKLSVVEYFWDTDPGVGSGIVLSDSVGETSAADYSLSIGQLAPGLHKLGARTKNEAGVWSAIEWLPIDILDNATALSRAASYVIEPAGKLLVAAEYFWDTDPGEGNGVPVSINTAQTFSAQPDLNIDGISVGVHKLGIRTKNGFGVWSAIEWLPVEILDNSAAIVKLPTVTANEPSKFLIAAEYFVDTDPGEGNGIPVAFSPAETFSTLQNLDISTLAAGLHKIGIRTKNALGQWSEVNWMPLQIQDNASMLAELPRPGDASGKVLISGEYFWDADPGAGNGAPVAFPAGATFNFGPPGTNTLTLDISQLPGGLHQLGMRIKELSGRWGPIEWTPVEVPGVPVSKFNGQFPPQNVVVATNGQTFTVELQSSFPNGIILYSTDGSEPIAGEIYSGPFSIAAPFHLRTLELLQAVEGDPVYSLIASSPGGGGVSVVFQTNAVTGEVAIIANASASSGWTFLNWAGDATGASPSFTMVMDGPKVAQAIFSTSFVPTVNGSGIIQREPAQTRYPYGSIVRLTGLPNAGNFFRQWGGAASSQLNPFDFKITNANPTLVGFFGALPAGFFALTTTIEGNGTVTKNPQQQNYTNGASVTLTATPTAGNHFVGWYGDTNSDTNVLVVTMTASKAIIARFESDAVINQLPLTAIQLPSDGAVFIAPVNVTISATASDADGSLAQLTILDGATPLKSFTAPPFTYVWNTVPLGAHILTTIAVDNRGASVTSNPVNITITPAPNQPPAVTLLEPDSATFFRVPTNILLVAEATDDEAVARVDFYGNGILLGTGAVGAVANRYSFVWTNAPAGLNSVFVRAFDARNASSSTLPREITVQQPEQTSFKWAKADYTVAENAGDVALTVLKAGVQAARVQYAVRGRSAENGKDFAEASGTLQFGAEEISKIVHVTLLNEYVPDGAKDFEAQLISMDGVPVQDPSITVVTILDDDASLAHSSFLEFGIPDGRPALRGRLQMYLEPAGVAGQWRFPWELTWRNSGDVAEDLDPGEYSVEFRPLANYLAPTPSLETALGGITVVRTNVYTFDSALVGGSLVVQFSPMDAIGALSPGWRFSGETAYRTNGQIVTNIPAGIQVIEFKPLSGWVTPSKREVLIQQEVDTKVLVAYLLDSPPALGVATPTPLPSYAAVRDGFIASPRQPYPTVGQLRSVAGLGSGVAVRERVVLTAAHVLFDEATLDFVPAVEWFGARHAGEYEPRGITARGWYVNTNYLAERRRERIELGYKPGVSSAASQQWDFAAIFFDEPVVRNGFSGYLLSDLDNNEWLMSSRQKELLGYPLYGAAEGRMHYIFPFNFTFSHDSGRLFSTAQFLSYPGNSGGPICVSFTRFDGDVYFPAAVYLGNVNNRSLARVIDSDVASLINRAASSAALGVNFVDSGVIKLPPDPGGLLQVTKLTVQISPSALAATAGWRLQGTAAYKAPGVSATVPVGPAVIEFKPVPGYTTPTNRSLILSPNQEVTIQVSYAPAANLDPARFTRFELISGALKMRVRRPAAGLVEVETSNDLRTWSTLRTIEVAADVETDFEISVPKDRNGFLRLKNVP